MHVLHSILHIFLMALVGRICLKCIWQIFFYLLDRIHTVSWYQQRKKFFDIDFSSPRFNRLKTWNFTSGGVQNRARDWEWLWRQNRTSCFAASKFLGHFASCFRVGVNCCEKEWCKNALFMAVATRKTRKKVFLFIQYLSTTILDQKPWKEDENGFPSSVPLARSGLPANTRLSVRCISRPKTLYGCPSKKTHYSKDWKRWNWRSTSA